MRWLLQAVAVVLFVIAAILTEHAIGGSDLADAFCFGFAGLVCWCLSSLPEPPRSG